MLTNMNAQKCVHCFTRRPTYFISRFATKRRSYCVLFKEKKRSSAMTCLSFPQKSSQYNFSEVTKPEQSFGEQSTNYISVPNLKFEDLSFRNPVSHEELLVALKQCKNIDEQMETLASTLGLSNEDIQKRVTFCKNLEKLFEPFFANFKIQMFGSSVNCFGFKGCDVDMTFETVSGEIIEDAYYDPDVPLVSEVINGKVPLSEIAALPPKEKMIFIHTLFLEFYKEGWEPAIFINAHVPLVRFHHDKFNLKCDLTHKNKVAAANTKMLYLFAKLDPRVVPLMMTIRYWAKYVELIGKNMLFNTYTVSLLVIHFLQTRDPPVLPSANHVMSLTDGFETDDMNDKSFLNVLNKIPSSLNTKSAGELLKEFFFYYLYFDFTRVVCPAISTSVSRKEFFSKEENRKFRMNSVCVQDPMCLSHNVAEFVDFRSCRKLFHSLMGGCKVFQDSKMLTHSEQPWGLMAILDKPEDMDIEQKLISVSIHHQNSAKETSESVLDVLERVLLMDCKVLELSDVLDRLRTQDEVLEKQRKILESVVGKEKELNAITAPFRKRSNKKQSRNSRLHDLPSDSLMDEFQNFNAQHQLVLCAECRASKNVWLGRTLVDVEPRLSLMEKEHFISLEVAQLNKRIFTEKKVKPVVFLLECYVHQSSAEKSIIVNFRPLEKIHFHPILGIFLKEYLPNIITQMNTL